MISKLDLLDKEIELNQTRIKLNKLVALNLSLYNAIINYAKRKDIPLTFDSDIISLVEEIAEVDQIDISTFRADEFLQRNRTDKDFTEPCLAFTRLI